MLILAAVVLVALVLLVVQSFASHHNRGAMQIQTREGVRCCHCSKPIPNSDTEAAALMVCGECANRWANYKPA